MKYSVVMSVYEKDRAEWLSQAIDSILNQTLVCDDIIIVVDGPLTPELNKVIRRYQVINTISTIRLKSNQGLGSALNAGINKAKHEIIARMDADDIAVKNRFELQISEFSNNPKLEILGGQIAEFIDSIENIVSYRRVPTSHCDIMHFARRRSPFNHPTVMYKKTTIQQIGGYDESVIRVEDYDLWLRALSHEVHCANLDSVLLYYRSNNDAMKRRKTFTSLKNHIHSRTNFYRRGYISLTDLLYGVTSQIVLFIIPASLASALFRRVVRNA